MESTTPIETPAYLGIQDSRWPKEPRTFERFAVQEIRDSGENFLSNRAPRQNEVSPTTFRSVAGRLKPPLCSTSELLDQILSVSTTDGPGMRGKFPTPLMKAELPRLPSPMKN
jgi:hypothetical protein